MTYKPEHFSDFFRKHASVLEAVSQQLAFNFEVPAQRLINAGFEQIGADRFTISGDDLWEMYIAYRDGSEYDRPSKQLRGSLGAGMTSNVGRVRPPRLWPIYNIEIMNTNQLRDFARKYAGAKGYQLLYPGKGWNLPPQAFLAGRILVAMANAKLANDKQYFEMLYERLPAWAQWRNAAYRPDVKWDVQACAPRKFRKNPPKKLFIKTIDMGTSMR